MQTQQFDQFLQELKSLAIHRGVHFEHELPSNPEARHTHSRMHRIHIGRYCVTVSLPLVKNSEMEIRLLEVGCPQDTPACHREAYRHKIIYSNASDATVVAYLFDALREK